MTITAPRIGTGDMDDPYRPDVAASNWRVISETETEFVVEILDG